MTITTFSNGRNYIFLAPLLHPLCGRYYVSLAGMIIALAFATVYKRALESHQGTGERDLRPERVAEHRRWSQRGGQTKPADH
ncbi:hypothetical protein L873DRAFT_1824291 [Choiromyces venosus 120613-1]|uniref:Uncharacterized protein n=1 Tax=Choiromyces venosus 120613-1 TaxID=1336337 RepID=A0A3N4IWB7_9PEZI|nr:hypothetical protein L873DRAFT_1824291 [Choiromyces venosus 120613-1]